MTSGWPVLYGAHSCPNPLVLISSSFTVSLRKILNPTKSISVFLRKPVSLISSKSISVSSNSVVAQSKVSPENNHNGEEEDSFKVVSFYCFVYIQDPEDLVSNHLSFLQGLDIRGRIYVNEQGINAQYSGSSTNALAYVEWLKEDHRFSDVLVQISPALDGHAFPRLKVQYKPSLVQLEGGISHLPLLDSSMRATPLAPSEWRKRLEAVNNVDGASSLDLNQNFILLDVRNGYEWDIGHFHGAQRPDVGCFRSTSFGLSRSERYKLVGKAFQSCESAAEGQRRTSTSPPGRTQCFVYQMEKRPLLPCKASSDPLASADKESTDVLMYCTGGIRCDIYSAVLRQKGFKNLFTLKGGVSHYLKKEGPVKWVGNLFVFDSRLSLPPSAYKPEAVIRDSPHMEYEHSSFARCYICYSCLNELRHRNCANLDCNRLFLCCANCVVEVHGCCCLDCTSAPRLRPILTGNQRYEKWHIYRDLEPQRSKLL